MSSKNLDAEEKRAVSANPSTTLRRTPRKSTTEGAEGGAKGTPFEVVCSSQGSALTELTVTQLRQLAGRIQKPFTPLRRAASVEPTSVNYTARHNAAAQARTPRTRGPSRAVPSKRGPPTTPHAIRALQQRRAAALTPGRDRRRSGRMQRETPRDILRQLSRGKLQLHFGCLYCIMTPRSVQS